MAIVEYSNAIFSNPELWSKVYSSKQYTEGLRLHALKIADRLEGRLSPNDNILDDLVASFRSAGHELVDAENMAWEILNLLGNSGPNMHVRTTWLAPFTQKSAALELIAHSLPLLDTMKNDAGYSLYSLPKEVRSSCDNTKTYVFWMTASLARAVVREAGLTVDEAAKLTFTALKLYSVRREFFAPLARYSKNAILTRSVFDPAHQVVRTDLAQGAVAAIYGASMNPQRLKLNVNEVLVELLKTAPAFTPFSKQDAANLSIIESYQQWLKLFDPEVAFRAATTQSTTTKKQ